MTIKVKAAHGEEACKEGLYNMRLLNTDKKVDMHIKISSAGIANKK